MIERRLFLAALGAAPAARAQTPPLKFGHRAASLRMVGDFDVVRLAAQIPGLAGIELQVAQGEPNLWDLDAVRRYKREGYPKFT